MLVEQTAARQCRSRKPILHVAGRRRNLQSYSLRYAIMMPTEIPNRNHPVPKLQISFASCPYDRLNPIINGRVPIEGCDVNFFPLRPEELFPRIFSTQDFDVTELSASSHILDQPARRFRLLGVGFRVARVPPRRHLHSHRPRNSHP